MSTDTCLLNDKCRARSRGAKALCEVLQTMAMHYAGVNVSAALLSGLGCYAVDRFMQIAHRRGAKAPCEVLDY